MRWEGADGGFQDFGHDLGGGTAGLFQYGKKRDAALFVFAPFQLIKG